MTIQGTTREHLRVLATLSENQAQSPPRTRFHISKRNQIILFFLVAASIIGFLSIISKTTYQHDVYITNIKVTKDQIVILNETFDKPINQTNVEHPNLMQIVSGENIPMGNCLAMDESLPDAAGTYHLTPSSAMDFNVLNFTWIEKQIRDANPSTTITIVSENVSLIARIRPYYRNDKPTILLDISYFNNTSLQPIFYTNLGGINAPLTDWNRFSIIISRSENVIDVYVNGESVCWSAIRIGFLRSLMDVHWVG